MRPKLVFRQNLCKSNVSCHDPQDFVPVFGERNQDVAKGTEKMVIFALMIHAMVFLGLFMCKLLSKI